MTTHKNLPYLLHILDAINDIEESVRKLSRKEFEQAKDARDAAIRRIEIIGEAVKNLSVDLKESHPEIEWKKIAGTRDKIIHAYFDIDLGVVWDIIKNDLPILKKKIENIRRLMKE